MNRGAFLHHACALALGCAVLAACAQQRQAQPGPAPARAPPSRPAKAAPPPTKVVEQVIVRCPGETAIDRLLAAKPKPLRDQKMPATTAERVAKTAAQLGLYEAEGQWADQVAKALRDCGDK